MGYAGRHNIYEGSIHKRIMKALEAQEELFRQEHDRDSDEQLVNYVKMCAEELQHSPWPGEIVGGTVIEARLGSWEKVLQLAQLPLPDTQNKSSQFLRVQQEAERQKEAYRQKKTDKKLLAEKRRARQAEKKK